MFTRNCPLGNKCVCGNYKPVSIVVAELRMYLEAQRALVLSPLNVWATGEEVRCDPRNLVDKEREERLWIHFIKSGAAKRFAEMTRRGQTTITVCGHLIEKDGT